MARSRPRMNNASSPPQQQQRQQRRSKCSGLQLYWYIGLPSLIVFALWSLRDLSQSIHQEKMVSQYPGMHNSKNLDRYKQNYYAGNPQQQQQQIGKPSYPKFLMTLEKERQALLLKSRKTTTSKSWWNMAKTSLDSSERTTTTTTTTTADTTTKWWKLAQTPPDQPVHFTVNRILPPPRVVDEYTNGNTTTTTVFLVLSGQHNFLKRQAIRETWAANHTNVYFVIGQSNCDESADNPYNTNNHNNNQEEEQEEEQHNDDYQQAENDDENDEGQRRRRRRLQEEDSKKNHNTTAALPPCQQSDHDFLLQEQLKYQDLLEIPMKEHYRLLPEKVVQAYAWALQTLPEVRWMVKVDDDMMVRIDSLERYLKKYNSQIPMVIGQIVPHSAVSREGKWAETDYAPSHYPYWAQGSAGHVVSRATAKYISEYSESLHRYQGEDVSLGIWMHEAAKENAKNHLDDITYIQAKRMISNGGTDKCGSPKYLMIGHDMSPEEIYDCQLKFGDQTFTENAWLDDPAEFEKEINEGSWGNTFGSLWNSGGASASTSTSTPISEASSSTPVGYQGPWANSGGKSAASLPVGYKGSAMSMFKKGSASGYRLPPSI